jgi:hypothetical protein
MNFKEEFSPQMSQMNADRVGGKECYNGEHGRLSISQAVEFK